MLYHPKRIFSTIERTFVLAVSAIVFVACSLYDLVLQLAGRKPPGRCVVLYYHAVSVRHKSRFERQMNDLLRFAEPTTAARVSPLKPGKRYAVVTFDDAYRNILTNALPYLKTRQIPTTVFAVSNILGASLPSCDKSTTTIEEGRIMQREALQDLIRDGVTIGSHSLSHPHLTKIRLEDAAHELSESRRVLEEMLKRPVELFCFPYGACSEELFRLCREAGYIRVFTTVPKFAFCDPTEFVIGRVRVDPTDWRLEFLLKLCGAYRWLPVAWAIKRRVFEGIVEALARWACSPSN